MSEQLDEWRGDFGVARTDRNVLDWRTRVDAFRRILDGREIRSALEIGCNRGDNLAALHDIMGPGSHVAGAEPQDYARSIAARISPEISVIAGTIYDVPAEDRGRVFPELNLVGTGDLTVAEGFDQARWWLLER